MQILLAGEQRSNESSRDELMGVEVPDDDKVNWKTEFDKMDAISKALYSVVSLAWVRLLREHHTTEDI